MKDDSQQQPSSDTPPGSTNQQPESSSAVAVPFPMILPKMQPASPARVPTISAGVSQQLAPAPQMKEGLPSETAIKEAGAEARSDANPASAMVRSISPNLAPTPAKIRPSGSGKGSAFSPVFSFVDIQINISHLSFMGALMRFSLLQPDLE